MSSSAYSADIWPDPRLRRIVLGTGILLAALGGILIVLLPLPAWAILVAGAGWTAWAVAELLRLWRCYDNCRRLRLSADGGLQVLDTEGRWCAAALLPGSVLLQHVGWLRVRIHGGATFGELLRGDSRASADWRRLRVLWRHVGATP